MVRVTLSAAATVCGRIGPMPVASQRDRERLLSLRCAHDASIIGAATLRRDDPRLVCGRSGRLRCVVTGSGRIPVEGKGFFSVGDTPVVFTSLEAEARLAQRLDGVATVVGIPWVDKWLRWDRILEWLEAAGVGSLLLEGGGRLNHSALSQGVIDVLEITLAPRISGDLGAPLLFSGEGPVGGPFVELELERCSVADGGELFLRYSIRSRAK